MNKNVIRSITGIAVLFCLLWLIGLGWAVGEYYAGKPEKIPEAKTVSKVDIFFIQATREPSFNEARVTSLNLLTEDLQFKMYISAFQM